MSGIHSAGYVIAIQTIETLVGCAIQENGELESYQLQQLQL